MHSNVSESTSNHAAEDADISHTTESNGEEEHLQLSLVESFFLAFGLDCLQIVSSDEVCANYLKANKSHPSNH